ncbi:sulfurtransferase [Phycisphaerales bacterium AB-hyl4]|uniref:Sulfurtransferase n=1 Tax=Natronomicrosphaera hydrolytica TaxID=3242702 RepID=A0ABV4U2X7_9BACT
MMRYATVALAAFLTIGLSNASAETDRLVSTDWVMENLNNPDVRIVEVSVDPGVYERGHLRNAVNFRWHSDLVDPVKRDIVSQEDFEQLMSRSGIANDTTVVLYGDHNNWFAAWGAWVFDIYGHADVRLMDGGRAKWEREGRPMEVRQPDLRATEYTVEQTNPQLRARLADVLAVVEDGEDGALVDIRSPEEYSGRVIAPAGIQELAIRAGHVPGAKNVPWDHAVNKEDGTFKSADELREMYAAVGIDGSKPVIVYCRIGERSSHTWFALKHILGYDVRNYDGSWTEYGNAVGVPIDNPAGTIWTGK